MLKADAYLQRGGDNDGNAELKVRLLDVGAPLVELDAVAEADDAQQPAGGHEHDVEEEPGGVGAGDDAEVAREEEADGHEDAEAHSHEHGVVLGTGRGRGGGGGDGMEGQEKGAKLNSVAKSGRRSMEGRAAKCAMAGKKRRATTTGVGEHRRRMTIATQAKTLQVPAPTSLSR